MPKGIGTIPDDINLNMYTSSYAGSVNNGSPAQLSAYSGSAKPLILAFVNMSNAYGTTWLEALPSIKSTMNCNIYVVIFKHDGSVYSAPNNLFEVKPYIAAHGGHTSYMTIPIVIDTDGSTSEAYRLALSGLPSTRDTWSYLIDPAYMICDRWHTASVSPGYPISFTHIKLTPDPGVFNGGSLATTQPYVQQRILNLNAPLIILDSDPTNLSDLYLASAMKKIYFSRPLQDAGAVTAGNYSLTGGGLLSPPVSATSATYAGNDKAENAVALGFVAELTDGGDHSVVLNASKTGIKDTSGGALIDPSTRNFTEKPAVVSGTALTKNNQPQWNWTAVAGATRYRWSYDGATWTILGNVLSYTPASALADGPHTFYVQAGDASGNWSASGQYETIVDTTGPTVVLSDDHADAIVRDADTVHITATFTESNGIDEVAPPAITIGSLVVNIAMTKVTNLVWTYPWNVPSGNNGPVTVSVAAKDAAGNASAAPTGKINYTIDNIAPTVVLSDDHADAVVRDADSVLITATFTESNGIDEVAPPTITIGSLVVNLAMTKVTNLVWTYPWNVPSGNNGPVAVSVAAKDVAGNSCSAATGKTIYTIDNEAPTITISAPSVSSAAPGSSVTYTLTYAGANSVTLALADITLNKIGSANGSVSVSGSGTTTRTVTISSVSGSGSLGFSVAAGTAGDTAGNTAAAAGPSVTFDVSVQRDLVIVIDDSGSMGETVVYGASASRPKLEYVKDAVQLFAEAWKEFSSASDRCGLVVFQSQASKWQPTLQPFLSSCDSLETAMAAIPVQPMSAMTAQGSGIANGLDLLGYSTPDASYPSAAVHGKRALLLFADGQNNMSPNIVFSPTASPTSFSIATAGNAATGCPDLGTVSLPHSNTTIPMHCFGIASPSDDISWLTSLADLSRITGGQDHATDVNQIWPAAKTSLEDFLTVVYAGSSPQVIARFTDTLATTTGYSAPLTVNVSSTKIVLSLSWPGSVPVNVKLYRNGALQAFTRQTVRKQFSISVLAFGGSVPKPTLSDEWRVVVGKTSARPIHIEGNYILSDSGVSKPFIDLREVAPAKPRNRLMSAIQGMTLSEISASLSSAKKEAATATEAPFSLSVIADEKAVSIRTEMIPIFARPNQLIPINVELLEHGNPIEAIQIGHAQIDPALGSVIPSGHEIPDIGPIEHGGINIDQGGIYIGQGGIDIGHGGIDIGSAGIDLGGIDFGTFGSGGLLNVFAKSAASVRVKAPLISAPQELNFARIPIKGRSLQQSTMTAPAKKGIYRVDCVIQGTAKESGPFQRVFTRTIIVT